MTENKTKKAEKVFFDLMYKSPYDDKPYQVMQSSVSIDLADLTEVSVDAVMQYITKNAHEFFNKDCKQEMRIKGCHVYTAADYEGTGLMHNVIYLFYENDDGNMFSIYIIITNIRLIIYDI